MILNPKKNTIIRSKEEIIKMIEALNAEYKENEALVNTTKRGTATGLTASMDFVGTLRKIEILAWLLGQ